MEGESALFYYFADRVFHETLENWDPVSSRFPLVEAPLPPGWKRAERGPWHSLGREGTRLPDQGWKIHISATLDTCETVLDTVSEYCFAEGISFKFLRTSRALEAMNHKYAPRSSSGKFITLYPVDEESLHKCLSRLGEALRDYPGPYVLTDCRWGEGPLHFRYGAFRDMRHWTSTGERVPVIHDPDGTPVRDSRQPIFQVPEWVRPPAFLEPHIAHRAAGTAELDFQVTEALDFSSAGGVYTGTMKDGGLPVVVKEARPYTGGRADGIDAVARLHREHRALRELDDLPGVPRSYGMRKAWEHEFLVMERAPGTSLHRWLLKNHPLLWMRPYTDADLAEYVPRAERIWRGVAEIVEQVHGRGAVYGDLHPSNVMIDTENDDSVSLIDFEQASLSGDDPIRRMGAPGFFGFGKEDADFDLHALGMLRLWLYFPITKQVQLCPERLDDFVDEVERLFPVPEDFAEQVREATRPGRTADGLTRPKEVERIGLPPDLLPRSASEADPAALRASLTEAVKATASPERKDRLFPGGHRQFNEAPAGFAHGAAGVLWALWTAGGFRDESWERWLLDRAHDHRMRPGFYDGAHGTAYVLEELGYPETARDVVEEVAPEVGRMTSTTLYSGLAGVGLGLIRQGRTDQAQEIAGRLHETVHSGASNMPPGGKGKGGGLMYGWSGIALFLLRLDEATGKSDHYGTAVKALHRDLDLCSYTEEGALLVKDGLRLIPYLEEGAAGLGLVADTALRRGQDERLAEALPALVRGCRAPMALPASLFFGRLGLLAATHALSGVEHGLDVDPAVEHMAGMHWYPLALDGHLAFPARQGERLSMDVATGNAGALLTLSSVLGGAHPLLPFLPAPSKTTGSTPVGPVQLLASER